MDDDARGVIERCSIVLRLEMVAPLVFFFMLCGAGRWKSGVRGGGDEAGMAILRVLHISQGG